MNEPKPDPNISYEDWKHQQRLIFWAEGQKQREEQEKLAVEKAKAARERSENRTWWDWLLGIED